MKSEKEYKKLRKNFIRENDLNNDNVYDYLNENQINVLRKYYEVYTKFLFNRIMGSLRLEVSKSKIDKLISLKGAGSWEFAGMVDMLQKGAATCELGHPLRYVYSAKNIENGQLLHFGVRCVGDFFDIDTKGVNALAKVKDVMLSELKDLVSIQEQSLYDEHFNYDCGEFGKLFINFGLNGVKEIGNISPLMPIVLDFLVNKLPLPQSLIDELKKFDLEFCKKLDDSEFIGIDKEKVELLKNSRIQVISLMFGYSEDTIKKNIKKGNIKNIKSSDFYNFNSINDINVAASVWINRNDRLLKAFDYFKGLGINQDWVRIYKYIINNGYKREVPNLYFALEILILFEPDIIPNQSFNSPKMYAYRGYELNEKAKENFDSIIDFMATREFIMSLKEIQSILDSEDRKEEEEKREHEEMIKYLDSHLLEDKYMYIAGIAGVTDIIKNKKLSYDNMTERQQGFVCSVYKAMKNLDSKEQSQSNNVSVEDREINNRYKLVEKPDILAKIQRLQTEAGNELSEKIIGIIYSVMTYKQVSDKQINRINEAYSKYILKEEVIDSRDNKIGKGIENRKWNLKERGDVKAKIEKIQSLPDYLSIPSGVRNIFENILKYNSVSDKQIDIVERTYVRYFKG